MRRHAVVLAAALAWLISIESAEARLDILVDKATQRILVMQNGYMRYMWPVSTGRDETATPNGVYTPQRLERNWFSTAYYNSPMPYSIFFHNGYAIHGSYAIDRLGGPASHGCVRLHPHHAALLFDLVQQEGPSQTTIEISDDERPGGPPPMPAREVGAERGPPPALPPREIAAERGPYPPGPPREIVAERGPYPPGAPREIAAERGPYPPGPRREIALERDPYPPVPKIVRYRENADMGEPPPIPRANRPLAARNSLPPPPTLSPPPARRMLSDARPPASVPRAPCDADAANASSDCRPKPKLVEASPPPQPAPQAQPAPQPQAAPPTSTFKMLPASCWSGGASRWRWGSSPAPC